MLINITSKLVIIGDINVGKTALINKYVNNLNIIEHVATIGVDYLIKRISKIYENNRYEIKLHIWDTAGLERFRSITSIYYKNASYILILFDINNIDTFYNATSIWLDNVNKNINDNTFIILIGNKIDKTNILNENIINKWILNNNIPYFKTSIYDINSINNIFDFIINDIININKKNSFLEKSHIKIGSISPKNKCLYFC